MTHYVLRSKAGDPAVWQQRVEAYRNDVLAYETHCAKVKAGAKDPKGLPYQPYPNPAQGMDPDIVASVRPDIFTIDYELVDYLPIAAGDREALFARKGQLQHDVGILEEASLHNVLPARKWRYASMLHHQAVSKPEEERTEADKAVISEHDARLQRVSAIHLHYARQQSEIEDLDFDTVNTWRPTPI